MRVTNKMMSNNFLTDMNNNLQNLSKIQQQLTSGKEVRRPSDDPFKVARAMQLHTDINTNKQYNENITDASNWLDTTDTALNEVGSVLQRIRELLVSSGNAAYGSDERNAIKNEINQKVGELTQALNTNFDGKYIFGGTRGTSKPVMDQTIDGNTNIAYAHKDGSQITDPADPELNMIKGKLNIEVSQGVTIDYNVTASDVLEFTDENGTSQDLGSILKNITYHLDGKDSSGAVDSSASDNLTGQDMTDITNAITNVLSLRSEVGAKSNRMQSAADNNTTENTNMTEILSKTEDIDITQKTMEYANMQTIYTASLQTSAKVIQPTLLDYLR